MKEPKGLHGGCKFGGRRSEVGSRMSEVGSRKSDVGCRMSDVGCRMSDVGCRMSDVGSRKSEVGSRKSDGGWRMADGGWRMAEVGWRMADGGRRMADGGWRMAEGGRRYVSLERRNGPGFLIIEPITRFSFLKKFVFGGGNVLAVSCKSDRRFSFSVFTVAISQFAYKVCLIATFGPCFSQTAEFDSLVQSVLLTENAYLF